MSLCTTSTRIRAGKRGNEKGVEWDCGVSDQLPRGEMYRWFAAIPSLRDFTSVPSRTFFRSSEAMLGGGNSIWKYGCPDAVFFFCYPSEAGGDCEEEVGGFFASETWRETWSGEFSFLISCGGVDGRGVDTGI